MANISFIAILIGVAGIAGGIETGSGMVTSTVILLLGIAGMTISTRKEGDEKGEDKEDNSIDHGGSSRLDKP